MKLNIVGAIFARGGSKGVPRKNIRLLAGKPLIAYAIECAKGVPRIGRVIVSTDDGEIAGSATHYGAEVPFLRPADLAQDSSPELHAWQHLIRSLNENTQTPVDILVSVPTTSPLRIPNDIDRCLSLLLDTDADLVITVREAQRSPYFNMVTLDETQRAHLVIAPTDSAIIRRQDVPRVYDITTVAYAARASYILQASTLFEGHVKAVTVPVERSLDIDTVLDFDIAEFLIGRQRPQS